MKTVIYVNGLEKTNDRRICAGVKAYAATVGWNVQSVHAIGRRAELDEIMSLWSPSGVVVNSGSGLNSMPISWFGKVPTVFFDHPHGKVRPDSCCVVNDAAATARLAAKELLSTGATKFAYVGWTKRTPWSEKRREHYAATLRLHDFETEFFDCSANGDAEPKTIRELADWLGGLGTPAGVFAANDHIASMVASACRLVGLSIPRDVALIGVDDDHDICEGTSPSISSISLDQFAAGRIAAEKLARLMSGKHGDNDGPTPYPTAGVVRRQSTRTFAKPDKLVADAVERIRREACAGLGAKEVVDAFPCSRRSAEMRFRSVTGHSVLEEIRRVRLEAAKTMLRTESVPIGVVAERCGYRSAAAFSIFFLAETGMQPSAWRAQAVRA
jgi:LacI family transcriptional regulator